MGDFVDYTCKDIDKRFPNTAKMAPLVIEVAITGGVHGKEANPSLPETAEEQAQSTYEAYQAGASLVHIHARKADSPGAISFLAKDYKKINALVREKCPNIIINNTGGDYQIIYTKPELSELGKDAGSIEAKPEVLSFDICPNQVRIDMKPRDGTASHFAKGGLIFDEIMGMTYGVAEDACRRMLEYDIKPEFEITNTQGFLFLQQLIDQGLAKPPFKIGLLLGAAGGLATPHHLFDLIQYIPLESKYVSVMGIGIAQWPLLAMAIAMGLNVRVGMEDNVYLEKGRLAKSNAELVEKAVSIAKLLGRPIATPTQARELLGISATPRGYTMP